MVSYLSNVPSYSQSIYDVASACALNRLKRRCKNDYDSVECNACKLYIRQYTPVDHTHAQLLMMQAERRASLIHKSSTGHRFPLGFLIALCLFLAYVFWTNDQKPDTVSASQEQVKTVQTNTAGSSSTSAVEIWPILKRISNDMKNKTDVNKDGKTNCIDAAVLFYQYYPNKNDVRIMSNPPLQHAFNVIKVNNIWRAVEPQAFYTNWYDSNTYWMRDIWGNQYDSTKNIDRTDYYIKWVK